MALKERPDAILLDLGLPGGNGLMVLERFKANISLGCTPVIIVTAEDPLVDEARTIKAGAASSFKSPCGSRQAHGGAAASSVGTT